MCQLSYCSKCLRHSIFIFKSNALTVYVSINAFYTKTINRNFYQVPHELVTFYHEFHYAVHGGDFGFCLFSHRKGENDSTQYAGKSYGDIFLS